MTVETEHYGWSWQEWDKESWPGDDVEFWMKICVICWAGPVTCLEDEDLELCDICSESKHER